MFNSGPIAVDTVGETCNCGEKSPRLFMQEGHQEASSPLSLSLFFLSDSFLFLNEQPNAKTWHKVSLSPYQNTWRGNRRVRKRDRGKEEMKEWGMFISPDLMGWVSLCMSHAQHEWSESCDECTHTVCTISVSVCSWFSVQRQCAVSSQRCCHDRDLRLLKLIMQMSHLSPLQLCIGHFSS